jgi:hypothetical protein
MEPHDIFNAFRTWNFDMNERPGSDAVLFSWYPWVSSAFDLAYKASKIEKEVRTCACKIPFQSCSITIFRFLAGQADYDYVAGGGWTVAAIWDLSVRGEASWFKAAASKRKIFQRSLFRNCFLDYTFSNSLYIHTSFLYYSMGQQKRACGVFPLI